MAIKKSDLYASLWASCDELRGGMDASQYKDYVLFMLFIKYISDKYGNSSDFATPVAIPQGASFSDMVALKGKADIGDRINTQIIQPLIDANERLARSDFPDFNDPNKLGEGQAMVQRLSNLIGIFQKPELDFSHNRADHDDLLGDAYEYLMRHFATESGKSKGQFYTPSEVSRVIAQVIGISPANTRASTTAYDPTCGSGSLLLKVAAQAGRQITLEGQEKDVTTAGLARMNMILHDFPTANIVSGNTLAAPKFKDGEKLRSYDYVVANPPFSDKTWSTGLDPANDPYQRFAWGVPPNKQGDYAYLLHIIRAMKSSGKAACILPHGVLFRGNAESLIRQQLVRSGILKGIIGLPANLFYGTGIPACILVLDKENAAARKGVFLIDASKGFIKDGAKNRLREQDIHRIVDTFTRQVDVPRYARMVPLAEIADARNDYNLNLPRYIDSSEPEDLQDIDAHLNGGIPERDLDALADYWQVLPGLRGSLFTSEAIQSSPPLLTEAEPESARSAAQSSPLPLAEKGPEERAYSAAKFSPLPLAEKGPEERACSAAKFSPLPLAERGPEERACSAAKFSPLPLAGEGPGERARLGYSYLKLPIAEVRTAILDHPEFHVFNQAVTQRFANWRTTATQQLCSFGQDGHPKALIEHIAEDLLAAFREAPLLDPYDIYQHLMDYWAETMQDDAWLIAADGWVAKTSRILDTDKKGRTKDRGWTCELIPKPFIVARYFAAEQQALDDARAQLEESSAALGELEEEQSGEDGAFNGFERINAREVKDRIREIGRDPDGADELAVLRQWLALNQTETELKKTVKTLDASLDQQTHDQYARLGETDIQVLVIDDKWMAHLAAAVQGELERVSQTLTGRIRELAERYATPLPQLTDEVALLAARVEEHLAKMGASWK